MDKRIIYKRLDGGVSIVVPMTDDMDAVIARNALEGLDYQIVDVSDMLTDRTFRNAWKIEGAGIKVDMPKARDIHMGKIRAVRNRELTASDIEVARATENGGVGVELKAKRQALRDIPANFDLNQFTTPEELKVAWPPELPKDE